MITSPTVLILGAGASKPYGFPSGRELLYEIRGGLREEGFSFFREIKEQGIETGYIKDFCKELTYADPPSVDAFLEHRSEFLEVGKMAITLLLIPRENEKSLFDRPFDEHSWYQYLFEKLRAPSFDEFVGNNLSIITFNYDRSIEHYLFTVLKHRYNKSDEECAKILSNIPIIHVHGSLGSLPWQDASGRPYSPMYTINEIKAASGQIKVIPEQEDTSAEFKVSFEIMNTASEIYFLGFGYHTDNLRRLKIMNFHKKHPTGTAQGLGMKEKNRILGVWGIELHEEHNEILEFLKNRASLR
jgi:hypothetical protein